jgi:hypothetical protein
MTRDINFEPQHWSILIEALQRSFVSQPLSRAAVELTGDFEPGRRI